MNKKRLYKEIETNVVNDPSGRPAIILDDVDKIFYDLCFSKAKLDIHTLRAVKRLFASIRLTYKAMLENEQLDVNDPNATVYLSRKKVKKLIKKSLQISKKDRNLDESDMDELDDYLGPETASMALSREEAEELIKESIDQALKPYIGIFEAFQSKLKQLEPGQATAPKKSSKAKESKKSGEAPEDEPMNVDEEMVDDTVADVDFNALEKEKK